MTEAALRTVLSDGDARRRLSSARVFEILRGRQEPTSSIRVIPTESFASCADLAATLAQHRLPPDIQAS
jgi:hypothetical protein